MFCMSCGNKLSDNAKFCPACGSPVKSVVADNVEEVKEAVTENVEEVKEEVTQNASDIADELQKEVEKAGDSLSDAVDNVDNVDNVEVASSQVDLSVDESTLDAIKTPEIPKSELDIDSAFDDAKEEINEEVKETIAEAVEPVSQKVVEPQVEKINVAPVIPPVSVPNNNPQPVSPVNTSNHIPKEPAKKEHEAFKFFALIGAILSIVGCCLDIHTFNNFENGEYVSRTDKLYEFAEGVIIIAAMAFAIIFLLMRLSAFAMTGIVASIVAYALLVVRFYYDNRNILKDSEVAFKFGIGSFILWVGLILAFIGLFIRFGKKKLFKI